MSGFASNLKRLRKGANYTLEQLADALNSKYGTAYSKGTISKWENGTDPSMDSIRNISTFFGVTLDKLLGINVDPEDISTVDQYIPILGCIAAGVPLYAEQNILGYTPCPAFVKSKNRNMFYLRVRGDSMNMEFSDGSDVLVDRDAAVKSGDIAVVMIDGCDATVKKVKLDEDKIILIPMSNNSEHYAQAYDFAKTEVTIVGKVIGVYKRY